MNSAGGSLLASYEPGPGYDELVGGGHSPQGMASGLWRYLEAIGIEGLVERQQAADREIRSIGITFQTYQGTAAVDRPWPFDVIPRVLDSSEWDRIERGLVQRLRALNLFIDDVYHDQRCLRAGILPAELVLGSPNFRPECMGANPVGRIWAQVCGSDLVRDKDGTLYVLEDNLRVPSGVSYLLENRMVAKHVFPELFRYYSIEPVGLYVPRLCELLSSLSPVRDDPTMVVLTPGIHNSAYFEHAFLAQQMGLELVEGSDLLVLEDGTVCMRTVGGLERVDVIYRRIDELYLDPETLRRDSLIGVPGLLRAWRAGKVALANAPGAGVADDKAVYRFVPELIRYFLAEDPILPSVPTWRCGEPEDCRFVLDHLDSLVVKPANESGGYGVVIGPAASEDALAFVARRIEQHAPNWVAQPVVSLSTMPTLHDESIVPRHVDLRPFTLLGPEGSYVTPGGLTRVAQAEGSLIVNSSQGGSSKDTWIVSAAIEHEDPSPDATSATRSSPGRFDPIEATVTAALGGMDG